MSTASAFFAVIRIRQLCVDVIILIAVTFMVICSNMYAYVCAIHRVLLTPFAKQNHKQNFHVISQTIEVIISTKIREKECWNMQEIHIYTQPNLPRIHHQISYGTHIHSKRNMQWSTIFRLLKSAISEKSHNVRLSRSLMCLTLCDFSKIVDLRTECDSIQCCLHSAEKHTNWPTVHISFLYFYFHSDNWSLPSSSLQHL